jgi:hypothetical protein
MQYLSSGREIVAFVAVVAGSVLAVCALAWWLVVAFRAPRKGAPLTVVTLGVLLVLAPYIVHALNGRLIDLGRPVQVLEGQFHFHLAEPGGTDIERNVRIEALTAAVGAALVGCGIVWLMFRALAKETRARLRWPLVLLAIAVVLIATPIGINSFAVRYIDLGPRERVVDGEMHITLTGWDQKDYSVLRAKNDATLLQMANSDVTDETLKLLKGMTKLRELDLSDTSITDSGLAALSELPLERLRLARTKVTDAGFTEHIAGMATLAMVDLSGTDVKRETVDAWKKSRPGRKALH